MKGETLYYLAFSHCLGIGPVTFTELIEAFGTAQKAYEASERNLTEHLGPKLLAKFLAFRASFHPAKTYKNIVGKGITILTREDSRYPSQLHHIPDPPICLYVKGDLSVINFESDLFVGIVGTRKPSSYGAQMTRQFSETIAATGTVIVSGLALGVDTISHQSAIAVGGKTVAFLGCGVDIVYPPANRALYNQIVEKGGLVMSEFPPGMTVLPGLFVARNRLISGLSRGVLLIEGRKTSGGLITAKYAAEQGRDMFTIPVPLTSELSEASNILLKQGAMVATCPEDVLETYDVDTNVSAKGRSSSGRKINLTNSYEKLSSEEREVMELLANEALSGDEIGIQSKVKMSTLLPIISSLEMQGLIEKSVDGRYQVKV
jgi:DNA processing protein